MEKTELMYNEKYYQGAYRLDNTTDALYCILETSNEGETAFIHRILPSMSGEDPTPFIIADGVKIDENNISWGSASYYKTLHEATDTSDDRDVDIEKSMDVLMATYFNDKFLYIIDVGDEFSEVSQNAIIERYVDGYGWLNNEDYDSLHGEKGDLKVTKVNAEYVDLNGRRGQIDISMDLYNALYERQCSPELALSVSNAMKKNMELERAAEEEKKIKPSPKAVKK